MKCKCPLCGYQLEINANDYEEGDFLPCDDCGELLTIEVKKGAFRLVTGQQKKIEEMEGLDEEVEYEDEKE
ncbi:MAG TPA: hypothetical protein VFF09_01760 [archaeon]|nr:hypothetical protein [archaeon]